MCLATLANLYNCYFSISLSGNIADACMVAADETAVWLDMPSNRTVDNVGARTINVKTTGHEKTR